MTATPRRSASQWADVLLDPDTVRPVAPLPDPDGQGTAPVHDPLSWPGYAARQAQLDGRESVRVVEGRCGGWPVVVMSFDFEVLGGSMGTVAGRRLRRGYDHARTRGLPVVVVSCTGGARMQEGMRSLVQMPGALAAAIDHAEAGLLQVGVAAHPTTGGVYASVLTGADVIVAEPGAFVSFSGPRVAAALGDPESMRRRGAGSAGELALAGQVDAVVPPEHLAGWVARLLAAVAPDAPPAADGTSEDRPVIGSLTVEGLAVEELAVQGPFVGPAWDAVEASRAADRPAAAAVLDQLDLLVPLVGDRAGGVDPHTTVALARLGGRRLLVIAQDHGPVHPAGFRTAVRGMRLAARLGIPIVALVDTSGAAVGAAVDDAGQAGAISEALRCMLSVDVGVLAVVVGEGGSGGAIALAAADRLLVQRTATFSVIAPEGAAAILRRDPAEHAEVAELLWLRSADLLRLGIADAVVPDDAAATVAAIGTWLDDAPPADPVARRARWRRIADG
jgi:acyl-CoA carboxylase subunit beta